MSDAPAHAALPAAPTPPVSSAKRTTHLLVFFTVLIDLIGFGILIPLLQPLLRHLLAHSPNGFLANHQDFLVGAIMGVYSLMQFVFSPIMGRWSDRIGRRPVLIFSLLGSMAGYLVIAAACQQSFSAAWGVGLLFTARVFTGICGASIGTAQACLMDITAPEKRAGVMGMIGAAFGLGFMLGPVLGSWLSGLGLAVPFLTAAGMSLANALWCWKKLPETLAPENRAQNTRQNVWQTLRHFSQTAFPRIALGNFLVIAAFSMMTTSFVPWAEDELQLRQKEGHGDPRIGHIFCFIGLIAIFVQGGLIRRIAPNREKKLALVGIGIMAITLPLVPYTSLWASVLLIFGLLAVGNSLATPTLNSLGSQCSDPSSQGEIMGALAGFGSLGRAMGPMLTGMMLHLLPAKSQYVGTFSLAGILMLVAALAVARVPQPERKATAKA